MVAEFDCRLLLSTDTVDVWDVVCPGRWREASAEEFSARTHLVFPYRGIYVHRVGLADHVAKANQVALSNGGEPFGSATRSMAVMPPFQSESTRPLCWSSPRPTIAIRAADHRSIGPHCGSTLARRPSRPSYATASREAPSITLQQRPSRWKSSDTH
jgi:hypothetical protein